MADVSIAKGNNGKELTFEGEENRCRIIALSLLELPLSLAPAAQPRRRHPHMRDNFSSFFR
jgi:hypothetical protein